MINVYSDYSIENVLDFKFSSDDILYDYVLLNEKKEVDIEGRYILNGDYIIRRVHNGIRFGKKDRNDIRAVNVLELKEYVSFDLYIFNELVGHFIIEDYSLYECLAIITVAYLEGYSFSEISSIFNNENML